MHGFARRECRHACLVGMLKRPSQEKRDDDWKKAAASITDEEEMLPTKKQTAGGTEGRALSSVVCRDGTRQGCCGWM